MDNLSWQPELAQTSFFTPYCQTGKREKATSEREVKTTLTLNTSLTLWCLLLPRVPLPASSLKGKIHLFNSRSRAVEKVFVAAVWRKADGGRLLHSPSSYGASGYFYTEFNPEKKSFMAKICVWFLFIYLFIAFPLFQGKENRWLFLFNKM